MPDELELEALFADGLAVQGGGGSFVPLPSMPLLREPEVDEVSTAAGVAAGKIKQRATGEVDKPPPELEAISVGDEITLPPGILPKDETKSRVRRIDYKDRRIAVGKRKGKGYTFLSFARFEKLSGRKIAEQIHKQQTKDAKTEGRKPPPKPPQMPKAINLPEGRTLYAHQLENIAFLTEKKRGLIADEMGLGKAQPLDARVLTPTGWVKMGDLKVGDLVVDPDTGGGATVTAVYERGERDCYRVTMSDGCATECCDEHLWSVHTPNDKLRGKARVMPLSEIKNWLHQKTSRGDRRRRWFIPITVAVLGANQELPVDPYALGLMLGDGQMPPSQREGWGSPMYSSADQELVDALALALPPEVSVKKAGGYDYRISRKTARTPNTFTSALASLGLAGCRSHEKFVPHQYLQSDVSQRLALLQGLLDTDGHCTQSAVEYVTVSPMLRDAVVELVFSLGGFCSVYEKQAPAYTYKGERRIGKPAWRVYLRMPVNPFRLKRKAEAWKPTNMARGIEAVERVGRKPMRCIAVNSKRNLYITDGYIVTHNTATAIVALEAPAIVVCPAHLKVNWAREIAMWQPELSVAIIEGRTGQKSYDPKAPKPRRRTSRPTEEDISRLQMSADVVILNYEIIASNLDWVLRRQNKTVIADEAHYLKTMDIRWDTRARRHVIKKGAQRAKAFYRLQAAVDRLYLLTGTPILNRVKELFPLLHMIDKREWGSGFKFCQRYCAGHYEWVFVKGGRGQQKEVFACSGRSNSRELHEKVKGIYMMRHTKEEELVDLPAKIPRVVTVPMSPKWQQMYRQADQDFLKWLEEEGGFEAVGRAQLAEALVRLNKLREITSMGKVIPAVQWITRFFESTGRPLVVFALHLKTIDAIEEGLAAVNRKVAQANREGRMPPIARELRVDKLIGGMGAAKRQQVIDRFQLAGETDVLIYSIPLATGTTLTRAQDALFVERMWRPADLVQAEDRLHRIGQKNTVFIWYMDAEESIDQDMAKLLVEKSESSAAVIDGVDVSALKAAKEALGEALVNFPGFHQLSMESRQRIVDVLSEEEPTDALEKNRRGGYQDAYEEAARLGITMAEHLGEAELMPNVGAEDIEIFDEDGEWRDDYDV